MQPAVERFAHPPAAARSVRPICTTFSRPSANDNMVRATGKTKPLQPLPSRSMPTRHACASLPAPSAPASAAWSSSVQLARRAPRRRSGRSRSAGARPCASSPSRSSASRSQLRRDQLGQFVGDREVVGLERPRQRAPQLALGERGRRARARSRRSTRRAPAPWRGRRAAPARRARAPAARVRRARRASRVRTQERTGPDASGPAPSSAMSTLRGIIARSPQQRPPRLARPHRQPALRPRTNARGRP